MIDLDEILEGKHPTFQTAKLKKRLLQAGIKANRCEECGIVDHNGKPLVMHLDHIDGNSCNHRLENLRMLCPNCHSQTDTYSGRNHKNKERTTLAEKKAEKRRLAKAKHNAFIAPRIRDYEEIDKTRGWVGELAEKWGTSHTQVRRFVSKYMSMVSIV